NRFTSPAKSCVRESSTTAPVRLALGGALVAVLDVALRSQRRRGRLDAMSDTEIGETGRGAVTVASSFVPPASPSYDEGAAHSPSVLRATTAALSSRTLPGHG